MTRIQFLSRRVHTFAVAFVNRYCRIVESFDKSISHTAIRNPNQFIPMTGGKIGFGVIKIKACRGQSVFYVIDDSALDRIDI